MGESKIPFPKIPNGRGQPELREILADHFLTDILDVFESPVGQDASRIPTSEGLCIDFVLRKMGIPKKRTIDFHTGFILTGASVTFKETYPSFVYYSGPTVIKFKV